MKVTFPFSHSLRMQSPIDDVWMSIDALTDSGADYKDDQMGKWELSIERTDDIGGVLIARRKRA